MFYFDPSTSEEDPYSDNLEYEEVTDPTAIVGADWQTFSDIYSWGNYAPGPGEYTTNSVGTHGMWLPVNLTLVGKPLGAVQIGYWRRPVRPAHINTPEPTQSPDEVERHRQVAFFFGKRWSPGYR